MACPPRHAATCVAIDDGADPEALRRHGTPFELHVYPQGRHGLGLAEEAPRVAGWMNLCCNWLKEMGWKP